MNGIITYLNIYY